MAFCVKEGEVTNKRKFQRRGAKSYWQQRRRYLLEDVRWYLIEQQRKEAKRRKEVASG